MAGGIDSLLRTEELVGFFIRKLLPQKSVVSLYSQGRKEFLEVLKKETPLFTYNPPKELERTLWGLKFKTPLMNAAGMFKNGECSRMVEMQGAGAYIGGTGTYSKRAGVTEIGIHLPFVTYPKSHSASNKLGLNNDGDSVNYLRAERIKENLRIPIGWSISSPPEINDETDRLKLLVMSMMFYQQSGVDFLEINESCPNTESKMPGQNDFSRRLEYVKENFLGKRENFLGIRGRKLPVVVKFSNDTRIEQLPMIMDLLFENGFDGVNFGNASSNYSLMRESIHPSERKLYDFYTSTFGGGVSGKPLKEKSLELSARAVKYLKGGKPSQEFHVIRTGGIETPKDLKESLETGVSLCQWYTGYMTRFRKDGHDVYKRFFEEFGK